MARTPRMHGARKPQAQQHRTPRPSPAARGYDHEWYTVIRPPILERDGYQCVICGSFGRGSSLVVDHEIPHKGKADQKYRDPQNLRTLCQRCHNAKSGGERWKRAGRKRGQSASTPERVNCGLHN